VFLGFLPNTTQNILWFDPESSRVKIALSSGVGYAASESWLHRYVLMSDSCFASATLSSPSTNDHSGICLHLCAVFLFTRSWPPCPRHLVPAALSCDMLLQHQPCDMMSKTFPSSPLVPCQDHICFLYCLCFVLRRCRLWWRGHILAAT
jgi:hypothetical protein